MDPLRQITTPVAEVRVHAHAERDEYNEQWVVIDGIETKVPSIAAAQALCAKQDAVRVAIRAALDETGIRDKTVKETIIIDGESVEVELVPPALSDVFQIDMTRKHVPVYRPEPAVAPKRLSRWSRLKRAAKRLLRRKKGR